MALTLSVIAGLSLLLPGLFGASETQLQDEARTIRNRLRDRAGEDPLSSDRVWPEYVFHIERAKRARRYRPPGG